MIRLRYLMLVVLALGGVAAATAVQAAGSKDKHPNLTLYVTPTVAFAPARVRLVAELKGGTNDDQQFYCPAIEWDWGDGTASESSIDCALFTPGKTDVQRRFSTEQPNDSVSFSRFKI